MSVVSSRHAQNCYRGGNTTHSHIQRQIRIPVRPKLTAHRSQIGLLRSRAVRRERGRALSVRGARAKPGILYS
eukprot:1733918-Prymnesium_polylepis.3